MLQRLATRLLRPGRVLAIAVLALLACAGRANLNGTLAPATPVLIGLQVIALPLCVLILLPSQPLPEWANDPGSPASRSPSS